ncbi:MAG: carboxypeptidase-like regulatory domain-containing protein [Acidobacteriota bacterium]|nr:carboxypeptidase-like regulatory domain-containing protein [Acidobacteriota bacterium]
MPGNATFQRAIAAAHLLAVLLAGASVVRASAAAVTVTGKVTDENGIAVAGARIEMTAAGRPASTAVSDDVGAFAFAFEAPADYRVQAERQGYFVFTQDAVSLHEGSNLVTVTLNHLKEFADSVNVNYSPPVIDPQQTAQVKQINTLEILEVPYPASQDLRSALPIMQGVVQDSTGRLHFNGGATEQTNFTLNGFNISDPATGRLETRLNIESVQSMELESSRYSPEKDKGSAGSLDIKTEMGDNRWRFGATNFIPGLGSQDGFHINKWTPRLKVSGPLAKGRAWFHNGFDTFYDLNTVSGLPHGQNRSRSFISSNLTRLQVNLTASHILTGSFLVNYGQDSSQGLSFLNPIETTLNRRQRLTLASIKDQIYLEGGTLIEFGIADTRTFFRSSPQGQNTFQITPSGERGNYFEDLTRRGNRQQWLANVFLPPVKRFGAHQFKVGADLERIGFHSIADRHDYQVRRVDNSVAREVTFAGNRRQARTNFEASQYALDRWSPVDGLLIEAGFRSDWNEIVRDVLFSPRASAAYAPKWLGETKLSVGYGVFYDTLTLDMLTQQQEQVSYSNFFAPSGLLVRGPVETAFLLNERQLQVPRYKTLSFGIERKLPWNFYGRANFTNRSGGRGLAFVNDPNPTLAVFGDTNFYLLRNARRDRYQAGEFTVRRTFAGKYEWSAGYTRSLAHSNSVFEYSLENPIFAPQAAGPLSWDTPNRFVTWGWAPVQPTWLPRPLRFLVGDTSVAFLAEYRTGFPFSIVNEEGAIVGAPNSRRFPDYFDLNLHFERKFAFLNHLWAWRVGLNNLTNNGNSNVVNNNFDSPSFLAFGRGQPRAVAVRLRFLGKH